MYVYTIRVENWQNWASFQIQIYSRQKSSQQGPRVHLELGIRKSRSNTDKMISERDKGNF